MSNQNRRLLVPYISSWSNEHPFPMTVVGHPHGGIAYADETINDRDRNGVLWTRIASCPGEGRPRFGQAHSVRQRRAMRNLLCQVCARPADRNDDGVLWLLKDHRDDWPQWPERMACSEPPICLPCAHTASRVCPALRKGHVAVRVGHSRIAGVYGILYQPGRQFPRPGEDVRVAFDDPAIRWTRAAQLLRELHECTIVNLENSGP